MHGNSNPSSQDARLELVAEGLASPEQAQAYLSISRTHLYALMQQEKLPFLKVGRARRIPWVALRRYAAGLLKAE